ncbi:hypothetical protein BayCH28_03545 [Mycolicibacterium sp. CH28]|uniref:hypothetical protein n=1 Tax=Mycolicibacterium sp. CH28 TaxID=2512237 RepID=UPI001080740E|nr:hypothetical protein [Mycolicibacterium sp. CH28]TGD89689.1 hypothetical protein BayCH28_03545 [Mycolicibacterium sp. CH28]
MLATSLSFTTALAIAFGPPPHGETLPSVRSAPVALAGAWQDLAAHTEANLASLTDLITHYPPVPILTQLAKNQATYARWLVGQDGGNPALVVRTVGEHLAAVGAAVATFSVLMPLSLVGAFISPAIAAAYLVQATGTYPSTPQTWLQALIDAPAVYLDTTLNCCSTLLFNAAFGLLNPGPISLLLSLPISIAAALSITPPAPVPASVPASTGQAQASDPAAVAPPSVRRAQSGSGVAQSRRPRPDTDTMVGSRGAKPSAAVRTSTAADAPKATAGGQGRSARGVRPGSPGTQ